MENAGYKFSRASLIFITVVFIWQAAGFTAFAADAVRVGCVDIGNFINMDQSGYVSGYGAEYLNKISEYTGWEYDYVQAPWTECLELLKQGKLDLLMPAEYSQERAELFLYSDYECCVDFAALVGRKDDSRFYFDDYQGFDGIRVGMIRDNYLNGLFEEYAKQHGFSYRSVYYDTGTLLVDALNTEEVDAIINGNMEYSADQKLLSKIKYMPAYFIVSKENPELMNQLNGALQKIFTDNPYYTADLYHKYYDYIGMQFVELTREESDFIRQADPVDILVAPGNYPYEWYDTKDATCKGAYVDFMKYLSEESGLSFNFIPAISNTTGRDEVLQGRADVLLNAYKDDEKGAPADFSFTTSYYNCHFSLVGKKDKALDLFSGQRIAVLKGNEAICDFLAEKYPQWQISTYLTSTACLRAVENDMADCALVASLKLSADRALLGPSLVVVDGSTVTLPVSLCVSKRCSPLLTSVLSKCISKAGDNVMEECIFSTMLSAREVKDISYYIQTYPLYFAGIVGALCFLAAGVLLICHDSRQQKRQNQLLQKKNKELEEAVALQGLLRKKAQTDLLTGLTNKNTTEEFCRAYINNCTGEVSAILILDLDNFKKVNDELGHQTGDDVLKSFSAALRACVRPEDVIGRIGGDEFLIFLTRARDENYVREYADLIFESLGANCPSNITCSMGAALAVCGGMSYEEWFQLADKALYRAKGSGKNMYRIENAV